MVITAIYMLIKQELVFGAVTALQIRAGQRSITAFDCPYLSCNNHCDWWLFQEIFFSLLFIS